MQGLANLAQTGYGTGFLYRLDPMIKSLYLACFSLFAIMLDNLASLLCLLGLAVLIALWARLDSGKLKAMVFMAALITWGTIFSQAIFYYGEPRTVLWSISDNLNFYREGVEYGAIQSLRFSSMTIMGLVYCWTTDSAAMFRGLLRLKVPYLLSFMTVTAIRFLPAIMDEISQVMLAWRMRHGRFWSFNPFKMATNWLNIIRPVFINCYRRSNTLSLSIQSRGFSPKNDVTLHQDKDPKVFSVLAVCFPVALAITGLAAKVLYWLYLVGFHYVSELRWLYELNRLYL